MGSQALICSLSLLLFLSLVLCCICLEGTTIRNKELSDRSSHYRGAELVYNSGINDGKSKNLMRMRKLAYPLRVLEKLTTSSVTFSVNDYGAKGDGTDDTKAFQKAWEEACSSEEEAELVVPRKTYLLGPLTFSGPCKSNLTLKIYGTVKASGDRSDYKNDNRHWLIFDRVEDFVVQGGGTFDGNGKIWWQNSCKVDKSLPCTHAPTAVTFYKCNHLVVKNLAFQNAQQMHVSFQSSTNVKVSNLRVESPESSPNTDGIHVTATKNIQISNSIIGTGDDCISIVSGSEDVQATNIKCGPGHGISIGSLGKDNSEAYVSGIVVNGATLSGTTNGLRIKTWQGGSGSATNIRFQNIKMENVTNPIIIDQNYCDQDQPCKEQSTAVQVKNVVYKNIKGTSFSDVAIKFNCSESYPCQGITLQNVRLQKVGKGEAEASCNNVKLTESGTVSPKCP